MIERATIPGFSRYLVSPDGEVRRRGELQPLTPSPNDSGYLRVKLVDDAGRRRWKTIHTLVLEAFVGPRPSPKHHAAHGPHGAGCNAVTNLRWALPTENEADKRAQGTLAKGGARTATHPNTVRAMRRRHASGESVARIAKRFRLHRSSVARIVRGLRRS